MRVKVFRRKGDAAVEAVKVVRVFIGKYKLEVVKMVRGFYERNKTSLIKTLTILTTSSLHVPIKTLTILITSTAAFPLCIIFEFAHKSSSYNYPRNKTPGQEEV